jgi:hypothetical protein
MDPWSPEKLNEFLERLLSILNGTILTTLRYGYGDIDSMVVGAKAINTMVKRNYRTPTIDWDIHVWNGPYAKDLNSTTHSMVRDHLGKVLISALNTTIVTQKYRLEPLLKYYEVRDLKVTYEVADTVFQSYTGALYRVGHINLYSNKFKGESVIDLVPIPHVGDYVTYAGIKFLRLENIILDLKALTELPYHPKKEKYRARIELIRKAYENYSLSCNYYRYQLTHTGKEKYEDVVERCVKKTVMGVVDPLFPRYDREIPKRFRISREDILAHYRYYFSLSSDSKESVKIYSGALSGTWNMILLHNLLFPKEKIAEPGDINLLQKAILEGPKLKQDVYVYKTARYFFLRGHSNYDLIPGIVEPQPFFNSTSYDNELNFSPFMDPFADCCAFVIRIPSGSNVLIIGEQSSVPQEAELLLPYGCGFYITDKKVKQVTSNPGEVFYNEITVYYVDYISPEVMRKRGGSLIPKCIGLDCPNKTNDDLHSSMLNKLHSLQY